MKDYYQTLGLQPDGSEDQIRKAYRRLALKHHPDHNPGDPGAEERFKEISEAYGVLIDPDKRREYDRWRKSGVHEQEGREGFPFSQEEIFRDLFRDPRMSNIFEELFREFHRAGVRSDKRFFDQVFFGGRGMIFGGIFVWGPFGSSRVRVGGPRARERVSRTRTDQIKPSGFLKRLGQKIHRYLSGGQKALPEAEQQGSIQTQDFSYTLSIPPEDAQRGAWVKVAIDRGTGREVLKVKIPPGTRSGTRLRLKGKGRLAGARSGDLYLTIQYS